MSAKKSTIDTLYQCYRDVFNVDLNLDGSQPEKNERLGFDDQKFAERLKDSFDIDPIGVLFLGLMRNNVSDKLKSIKFSLGELHSKFDQFAILNQNLNALNEAMFKGDLAESLDKQQAFISSTIEQQIGRDLTPKEVHELSLESYECASDANTYMGHLRSLSLSCNPNASAPTSINDVIIGIRNIEDIYEAADLAPNGISIIALKLESKFDSRFMFLAKNEGHSVIYTDSMQGYTPGSGRRTLNDKTRSIRAKILPYELFELSQHYTAFETGRDSKSVVKTAPETDVFVFGSIKTINPLKVFSTVLLLQRITEEWNQDKDLQPLLTCSRITFDDTESLPVRFNDNKLVIGSTTATTHTLAHTTELSMNNTIPMGKCLGNSGGRNQVFEDHFDPIINSLSLLQASTEKESTTLNGQQSYSYIDVPTLSTPVRIVAIPDDYIGSRDEAIADVSYLVRSNKAQVLKTLINAEYESNKSSMIDFIREKCIDSKYIFNLAASMENKLPELTSLQKAALNEIGITESGSFSSNNFKYRSSIQRNFTSTGFGPTRADKVIRINEVKDKDGRKQSICPITGAKAEFFLTIDIKDAFDLETLMSVQRSDMPYNIGLLGIEPYVGNSNLSRIDPVASMKTPYQHCDFVIELGLSSTGLNKIRKELGLTKLTKAQLQEKDHYPKPEKSLFW